MVRVGQRARLQTSARECLPSADSIAPPAPHTTSTSHQLGSNIGVETLEHILYN